MRRARCWPPAPGSRRSMACLARCRSRRYRGQMFAVAAPAQRRPRHVIYGPRPISCRAASGSSSARRWSASDSMSHNTRRAGTPPRRWRNGSSPALAQAPSLVVGGPSPGNARPVADHGSRPRHPALIYACGHSRNGILMAPLTGDCITALRWPADAPPVACEPFPCRSGSSGPRSGCSPAWARRLLSSPAPVYFPDVAHVTQRRSFRCQIPLYQIMGRHRAAAAAGAQAVAGSRSEHRAGRITCS